MTKNDLIKRLQEIEVIYKEKVLLRSGEVSDFYCDIKKSFGHPDILNDLADKIGAKLHGEITCIAASGYGGLPLASVIASRFNKKFTAVRNTEKNHGKGGLIDGYTPQNNDVVVIVDDVLTSGSSIQETLSVLRKTSARVDSAIVIVRRGEPELPIAYLYIFTLDEIVKG